jgi:hypothetical protein
MTPAQRARTEFLARHAAMGGRNHWWMAYCPTHGETQHLSYLDGACIECQKEKLEAEDKARLLP